MATQAEHAPARIDRMRAVQQVGHAGVGVVDGAVDRTGLLDLPGPPCLPDLHDGDRHAFAVAKRDRLSAPEGRRMARSTPSYCAALMNPRAGRRRRSAAAPDRRADAR